ncbi:MAG: hypothetical protein QOF25_2340 [Mycobacterium sp.]|jgi:hypothetical protein|nr:hypothetical protein [Mycobacterium sp.]
MIAGPVTAVMTESLRTQAVDLAVAACPVTVGGADPCKLFPIVVVGLRF